MTTGGFTLSAGVCQLRTPADCSPLIGIVPDAPLGDSDQFVAPKGKVVAGMRERCVTSDDRAVTAIPDWMKVCDKPRCVEPPLSGMFSDDTFVPDECYLDVFTAVTAFAELSGRWVVVMGGSNSLLLSQTLGNMFTPGVFGTLNTAEALEELLSLPEVLETYMSPVTVQVLSLLDVVWEADAEGRPKIVYLHTTRWSDLGITGSITTWPAEQRLAFTTQLGNAPTMKDGLFRLTLLTTRYAPQAQSAVYALSTSLEDESATGSLYSWSGAHLVLLTQVGAWYALCATWKCPRDELSLEVRKANNEDTSKEVVHEVLVQELTDYMTAARGFCENDHLNCFFLSDVYAGDESGYNADFKFFYDLQSSVVDSFGEPFRSIDTWLLGGMRPTEVINGHYSSLLYMWVWQIILNSISDAPADVACPVSLSAAPSCLATTLRDAPPCVDCDCAEYDAACVAFPTTECRNWECANERPCSFTTLQHTLLGNATGEASLAFTVDLVAALALLANQTDDVACPTSRIHCGSETWAWAMAIVAAYMCLLIVIINCLRYKPEKKAEVETGTTVFEYAGCLSRKFHNYFFSHKGAAPKGEHLAGLNGARLLASVHIVVGHLYAKGAIDNVYLYSWVRP